MKVFSIFLIVFLAAILSFGAFAASEKTETWDISETPDDNVIATLNRNACGEGRDELVISGDGKMRSFSEDLAPWRKDYSYTIASVVIEEGVQNISPNLLAELIFLDRVIIKSATIDISVGEDETIPDIVMIVAHGISTAQLYSFVWDRNFEYICDFSDCICNECGYECVEHTGGEVSCLGGAECEICGYEYIPSNPHVIKFVDKKPADCLTDGKEAHYKCEECGTIFDSESNVIDEESLVIKAAHAFGELVSPTEPTCVNYGNIAHYRCSVCRRSFDEDKKEIANVYLPATGEHKGGEATCTESAICDICNSSYGDPNPENHSFKAEFDYNVMRHWHTCACGEKNGSEYHSYTDEIVKQPTQSEEGLKNSYCVCGYSFKSAIPKLVTEDNPVTDVPPIGNNDNPGESDSPAIVLIISISSGTALILGIAIFIIVRKKQKNKSR